MLLRRLVRNTADVGLRSARRQRVLGRAPHTHTLLMNSSQVAREVIHFLRHGRFERRFTP